MVKLLSRSQVWDYIRLEGLQKLTNVTAHDWDLYILKELVDNALDADEAAQGISPKIAVEMRYDGIGLAVFVRNQAEFPLQYVQDIFDLSQRASVKDYYNIPTRGAQGNALKTLLGIPYALQYRFFSNYAPKLQPLSIATGDTAVDLWLDVDEFAQTVTLRPIQPRTISRPIKGTEVSLGIFQFTQQQPRTADALRALARSFALWNPHATFDFAFIMNNEEIPFHSVGQPGWTSKYDLGTAAPIVWYTYGEFREILYALLSQARTHHEPEPTLADIAFVFGLPAFPPTPELPGSMSLSDLVKENRFLPGMTQRLYGLLVESAKQHIAPQLGKIGSAALKRGCRTPDEQADLFFYRYYATDSTVMPPFVLEVALGANDQGQREVVTGINHTPTYRDPFLSKPLAAPGDTETHRGLEKLLDHYGLRDDAPVTLAVHLISPSVVYENYGKSAISDELYRDRLCLLIAEVVEEYLTATRPPIPVDYLSEPARAQLPHVLRALAHAVFSENQLLSLLKKRLHAIGDEQIAADLAAPDADARLRSVIEDHHSASPIRGLFLRQTGRLAVPRHPRDAINVAFGDQPLLELLPAVQARAVVVTNRPELEELLLAMHFPVRYDLAILRADGNLGAALALFAKRMMIAINEAANEAANETRALVPIWLARDLSVEGARLVLEAREVVRKYHLPESSVVDLGLHVDDPALTDAWTELSSGPPALELAALRAGGIDPAEIQFYGSQQSSVRLDALPPEALVRWFERQLRRIGAPLKSTPDATSMAALAVEQLREQLRRVVERAAFESYALDDVLNEVIAGWRQEFPTWDEQLHAEVAQTMREEPRQSWQAAMDRVMRDMLKRHLTVQRLGQVRERIRSKR